MPANTTEILPLAPALSPILWQSGHLSRTQCRRRVSDGLRQLATAKYLRQMDIHTKENISSSHRSDYAHDNQDCRMHAQGWWTEELPSQGNTWKSDDAASKNAGCEACVGGANGEQMKSLRRQDIFWLFDITYSKNWQLLKKSLATSTDFITSDASNWNSIVAMSIALRERLPLSSLRRGDESRACLRQIQFWFSA